MDKDGHAGGGGGGAAKMVCKEWAPPDNHPRWPDRHALHLLLAKFKHKALKWARVRAKIAGYTCHVGLEKQQLAIAAVKREMHASLTMSVCNPYVDSIIWLRDPEGHYSLPSEIGLLPSLMCMALDGAHLRSVIPTEIGRLLHLRWMHLTGNRLTGKIPTELGRLGRLLDMQLEDNRLTGKIPTELGQLGQLRDLRLSWNKLTGRVPTELGRCSRLQGLTLSENQLTGKVPTLVQLLGSTWRALKPR
jgi:hypothetical protein